jgi:hypothetical protein
MISSAKRGPYKTRLLLSDSTIGDLRSLFWFPLTRKPLCLDNCCRSHTNTNMVCSNVRSARPIVLQKSAAPRPIAKSRQYSNESRFPIRARFGKSVLRSRGPKSFCKRIEGRTAAERNLGLDEYA